jgi:hypothetical protein
METDRNDLIKSSERGANRCIAVAIHIPCQPDARRKILPLVYITARPGV